MSLLSTPTLPLPELDGRARDIFRRIVEDAGMIISGVHVNLLGSDRPEQLLDRALRDLSGDDDAVIATAAVLAILTRMVWSRPLAVKPFSSAVA